MSSDSISTIEVSYILNGGQAHTSKSSVTPSRLSRRDLKRWRLSEKNKIQLLGLFFAGVLAYFNGQLFFGETTTYLLLFSRAVGVMVSLLGVVISLHISISVAPHCTPAHIMVIQYIFYQINNMMGLYYRMRMEQDSRDCAGSQERFLLRQMKLRGQCEYGRDHHFNSVKSVADFRSRHPLTGFAHYEKYMARAAAGEPNVVIPGVPSRLGITSGTTGKPKLIAISKERNVAFLFKIMPSIFRMVYRELTPLLSPVQKKCLLYVHHDAPKSEGGIPIGPTTMLVLPDILHRIQFSTPPAGMRLTNERQALYIHALFALRDRCIGNLGGIFCSTMFTFFQSLEADWCSLVNDLRHGRIASHIGLDDDVQAQLESELDPEPERADELEREFRKGFEGIARRIWPHLHAVWAVATGAMVVYARRLEAKYTKGIQIISSAYSSTEATVAVLYQAQGLHSTYMMLPSDIFCEFIPVEHSHEDQPETLLAEEVEVGQCYELVMTTVDALYRYRNGDVIRITKFHNKTPIFEFQYRTGEVLNVRCEKTPEASIASAIHATIQAWGDLSLVDFSAAESPIYEEALDITKWSSFGYYVIFIEVEDPFVKFGKGMKKREQFAADLEANLRVSAHRYNYYRANNAIDPVKVIFLQPEGVNDLRKYILERSTAHSQQLKLPHKLRKTEWIRVLCDRELPLE
ncbi:uncharacterized protein [Diadema antillarum]|uniref:uncharacterized protein n=1 Tax=Diadema antillarum TaxID=105358 RepID=UPI003A89F092